MIQSILDYFGIDVPTLSFISLGPFQEFSKTTMTLMGYFWDKENKVYYYRMKGIGKIIYNYDDPAEFALANEE